VNPTRRISSSIRGSLTDALARRAPPKAAPAWHRALAHAEPLTEASVLLPLVDRDGEAYLWLIRRPDTMKRHSGQVALPGGKRDPGDATPIETALRETEEEIGFARASIDVLGGLDRFPTTTGFAITPIVGWLHEDLAPTPNPHEIARVFCVPLAEFVFVAARPRPFRGAGWSRVSPSWEIAGEIVWGATAKILMEFVEVVNAIR
jgi:8-oxo-dGTP pyrophosphatase MutT (NUDIX family)